MNANAPRLDIFDRRGKTATDLRLKTLDIVREKVLKELPVPVRLASGVLSSIFFEGKEGLCIPTDLAVACMAIVDTAEELGLEFDAIGGPAMGANHLAFGSAGASRKSWFVVQKDEEDLEPYERRIAGLDIDSRHKVLVVEDVISTGGSLLTAMRKIDDTGAQIVGVSTIVDRGNSAHDMLAELEIPYFPLTTYADLGIEPVSVQ